MWAVISINYLVPHALCWWVGTDFMKFPVVYSHWRQKESMICNYLFTQLKRLFFLACRILFRFLDAVDLLKQYKLIL